MPAITHRLARILVAVAVASCGLPAWEHSHPGGDRPHDHRADRHRGGENLVHDGLAPSRPHRHVCLFGFDVSVPVDAGSDTSEIARLTLLTQSLQAPELQRSRGEFVIWSLPLRAPGEPVAAELDFHSKPVCAAFLSDTARHERSGVQLI